MVTKLVKWMLVGHYSKFPGTHNLDCYITTYNYFVFVQESS